MKDNTSIILIFFFNIYFTKKLSKIFLNVKNSEKDGHRADNHGFWLRKIHNLNSVLLREFFSAIDPCKSNKSVIL